MLTVSQLSKRVATAQGELTILQDIDLTVERGESVAIVGASGSGKSTLLSLMAGLDTPTEGRIVIQDVDITRLDEDGRAEFRARHVGFVFQSFHLLPTLTALENIALPLELKGDAQPFARARTLLTDIGLSERATHYPRQLSGGEQQRVAIARSFAADPDLLFADEPTGNLDTRTGEHVIELLFELNAQRNTTLILVTHESRLADKCQRIIELDAGRVITDRFHS
ncbi:MAG TPA: ABC transporter ATP-binding protein [Gammaproteobacteria bacterium]|jgi:putative ABC transport system ATP-binding protein